MNTTAFLPKTKAFPSISFANHIGYRHMFTPDKLTLGIFLPLRFYQGDEQVLKG